MTCRDVLDRVEAFAAGELQPDEAARAHLETCPQCASALAAARRIEAFLIAWPAPEAPGRFTAAVQHRIRRLHWQAEQRVDRLFNAAMVLAAGLVLGGIAAMFNVDLLLTGAGVLADVITVAGAEALEKAAPSVATYLAAMALVASALAMRWWTDGGFER
jgi:anti-sigma factor RsiW